MIPSIHTFDIQKICNFSEDSKDLFYEYGIVLPYPCYLNITDLFARTVHLHNIGFTTRFMDY